ncbi:MAG TPA: AraC family transcriptional regulator [Phenylobacterium sp.]|nr:AraC family transcriptional regulator [Phenylobacterium sp.]
MGDLLSSRAEVRDIYSGFAGEALDEPRAPRSGPAPSARLPVQDGAGYWDVVRLYDHLLVCVADSSYNDDYTLPIRVPEDLVSLRFVVAGAVGLQDGGPNEMRVEKGQASVLTLPADGDFDLNILGRERLTSLTLHLHAGNLAGVMGMEPDELPLALRNIDGPSQGFHHLGMRLTHGMESAVRDIVTASFQGSLRQRYLEAKVMEVLCLLVDAVETGERGTRSSQPLRPGERDSLHSARDILIAEFAQPPTIDQLGRRVGLNRTTLQRGFKEMFGVTIFEFCQARRMELARGLLLDGGLTISEVAEAVGYEHATNFTAAFRRRFNALPKDYRRG